MVVADALAAVATVGATAGFKTTLPKTAVEAAVVLLELTAKPICAELCNEMLWVAPICVQLIPSVL